MAASDFAREMRLVGERLLLKLQRLPQAEPVEIVAFSVIILFTGQPGLPQLPWLFLASRRRDQGASQRAGGAIPGREGKADVPWGKQGISPSPVTCCSSDGLGGAGNWRHPSIPTQG